MFDLNFYRQKQASNPNIKIKAFKKTTGISNIREHFCKDHLADWVTICDQLGITITGAHAISLVNQFRESQPGLQLHLMSSEAEPREVFSSEAFYRALAQWIVADDQVYFNHFYSILN